jgi:tRNA(His) guanylyltransferase
MRFDELDARMRVYETAHDHCVLPGLWIVVRLDGRGFTRLTKEVLDLERPFDARFRDVMVDVVRHLFDCGVPAVLGYTQSDEISLLLRRDADTFGRKERKLISVLAGEASGVASLRFGRAAAFDARVSQLPTRELVADYFRWRQTDAGRNALNAHCYWALRADGVAPAAAFAQVEGLSVAAKNELLFARGVNFDALPAWHKRGTAVHWQTVPIDGLDPRTGAVTASHRRRLAVEDQLPFGDALATWLDEVIASA